MGRLGQPVLGNRVLVDYGIQTENSDLRAHVCVLAEKVYVYRTSDGLSVVRSGKYPQRATYTNGIKTAIGCVVPADKIPRIEFVNIPKPWMEKLSFCLKDTETQKGQKAINVVKGLLKRGRFPMLALSAHEVDDEQLQIQGTDIQVKVNIQVKCDYRGGYGGNGCTGNLYLQVAECNPYKSI